MWQSPPSLIEELRVLDQRQFYRFRVTENHRVSKAPYRDSEQLNPANPGMSLHKLEKAKDKNFWSVRVSGDIRLIVHKTEGSLLFCSFIASPSV